jgi:hypothetical protein
VRRARWRARPDRAPHIGTSRPSRPHQPSLSIFAPSDPNLACRRAIVVCISPLVTRALEQEVVPAGGSDLQGQQRHRVTTATCLHVTTFAIDGVEPRRVSVEVDIRPGLPAFTIVGLGDSAVRESRERVRSAIANSGFDVPQRRITANLAPASLRKIGPCFDTAIALGILAASGQLDPSALAQIAVFGELSLGGQGPGRADRRRGSATPRAASADRVRRAGAGDGSDRGR